MTLATHVAKHTCSETSLVHSANWTRRRSSDGFKLFCFMMDEEDGIQWKWKEDG